MVEILQNVTVILVQVLLQILLEALARVRYPISRYPRQRGYSN